MMFPECAEYLPVCTGEVQMSEMVACYMRAAMTICLSG